MVTELATIYGWRWAHFRVARTKYGWRTAVSGPLGAGFPDLVLTRERDGRMLMVELKTDTGVYRTTNQSCSATSRTRRPPARLARSPHVATARLRRDPGGAAMRAYDHPIWRSAIRLAVMARDGGRCQALARSPGRECGRAASDVGHRVALVSGGEPYQLSNVEAQCAAHNRADGARLARNRSCHVRQSRRW